MTLKNKRAHLSNIKLYASFHHHLWIQTGVTVWKRLSWVVTSVTLTFEPWSWPFARTSLLSLVITPETLHCYMVVKYGVFVDKKNRLINTENGTYIKRNHHSMAHHMPRHRKQNRYYIVNTRRNDHICNGMPGIKLQKYTVICPEQSLFGDLI